MIYYQELKKLKNYQHSHERLDHKFQRRIEKPIANDSLYGRFFGQANRIGYQLLKTILCDDKSNSNFWYFDSKKLLACKAGQLYKSLYDIIRYLQEAEAVDSRLILETLENSKIFECVQFTGYAEMHRSEFEHHFRPLAVNAILRLMTVIMNKPDLANIFESTFIKDKVANFFTSCNFDHNTDPRLRTLSEKLPKHRYQEYFNDASLPPPTIADLAFKISAKKNCHLEDLPSETLASYIQSYLDETRKTASELDESFINTLINSDDGTGKNISIRGILSSNTLTAEDFVREAISQITNNTFQPG